MKTIRRSIVWSVALVLVRAAMAAGGDAPPAPRDVSSLLAPILAKHGVPGMAAAIVEGDRTGAIGAAGVRRVGGTERVTVDDRFHLGSCTKSMTATLCAMLVEEKKLAWTTTVGEVFPDLGEHANAAWRAVTLEQLLVHRGGAPADLTAGGLWARLWTFAGPPPDARQALLEGVVAREPEAAPGSKWIYSNAGFAIAGHMVEKTCGRSWEELMSERLFVPLGMSSAGFGAPGTPAVVDQPRGHGADGKPVEPGPGADNPVAIGPAGIVHASIGDWAKYVSLHLRGDQGDARLLKAETFAKLHAPAAGPPPSYAMGWMVAERDWAGGRVLTHNGSNTLWFCVTWLAPKRDFAVLVACNRGGDEASKACDEASSALVQDEIAAAAAAKKSLGANDGGGR